MPMALYRKYRSKSLDEIVGQSHVTDILARSLARGIISHAYLLTGPRGVGKTSIARILAHEINKLPYNEESPHLDIIEIDAASNNGVEDVRDLREKVQMAPVSAAKKIYIIDEVHMLSKAAFNALLKTLEEPPEHVVFILATTDSDKLPATIISRTQRFHFRTIGVTDAVKHLKHIAKQEDIKIDDDALELIAIRGEGSFRDSISLLDQLRSVADKDTGISRQLAEQSLGLAPIEHVRKLLDAYETKDLAAIVALLDESDHQGIQATILSSQLIQTIRKELVEKPQLIQLLDRLLEVAKSSHPNIKLLTILAASASVKPKNAALSSIPAEISAPIAELEKQATKPVPKVPTRQPQIETPQLSRSVTSSRDNLQPESDPEQSSRVTPLDRRDVPTRASLAPQAGLQPPVERPEETEVLRDDHDKAQDKEVSVNFNWDNLIDYTRQHHVAVYSVLSKCSHELDGETLVLYTKNAFYKKKLDDSKHRINLQKSLIEMRVGDLVIETIPTAPPPKDGQAAAVAAIMGGGEEVSVD